MHCGNGLENVSFFNFQIDPKPAMCKPSSQSTAVKKVFLGGLPAETTESDITKYFNENGIKVHVV